jgi:hypothetical protein
MSEKLYRAILIDPESRTVEVFVIRDDKSLLGDLHARIGAETLDHFIIADHETSWDQGWVEDGGLQRGQPIHGFLFEGSKDPIAGRCVLIGVDKDGRDACDARFPLDALKRCITWLGLIKPDVTWDEHEGALRAIVLYERVKA